MLTRRDQLFLKQGIQQEKRAEKDKKKEEKELGRVVASPARTAGRGRGRGRGRGGKQAAPTAVDDAAEGPAPKRARTVGEHLARARRAAEDSKAPEAPNGPVGEAAGAEVPNGDASFMGLPAPEHVPPMSPRPTAKAKARAKARAKGRAKASPKAKGAAKAKARAVAVVLMPRDEQRAQVAEEAVDAMIKRCGNMDFDGLKLALLSARKPNPKFELNVYWTRATVGLKMPELPAKPQVVQFQFVGDAQLPGSWNCRMVAAFVVAHELVAWLFPTVPMKAHVYLCCNLIGILPGVDSR